MRRRFFLHVRSGIHMNEETNACDDEQEQGRKLIILKREWNPQRIHIDELKVFHDNRCARILHLHENPEADSKRDKYGSTADDAGKCAGHLVTGKPDKQKAQQWKKGDESGYL